MPRINRIKILSILTLVFALSFAVVGCGGGEAEKSPGSNEAGGLDGTVLVTGSTSVQPLAQNLADVFNTEHPNITVEIQGGGSTQGVNDTAQGRSDIGTASRNLKDEEKSTLGLTEHIIAYDGIAIIVNPDNPVKDLTKEQVAGIFKGEITNWKDVGGLNKEIIVVTREEGSGTRGAFEELLGLEGEKNGVKVSLMSPTALVQQGTGAIRADIASKQNAIGYVSLGYINDTVQLVSLDGVECNVENIKTGSYPIARPFLMLTKGELSPAAQKYMDFIISDAGQAVVAKDYVPVN